MGNLEIRNWEVDVWYAVVILLICGFCGRTIATSYSEQFFGGIGLGIILLIISLVISLVFSFIIKNYYFKDEMEFVNSSILDFLLSVIIVIGLGFICRGMLGSSYLVIIVTSIIGMVVDYLGLLKKFFALFKPKNKSAGTDNNVGSNEKIKSNEKHQSKSVSKGKTKSASAEKTTSNSKKKLKNN